jgi:pyruvate dehydrogenase E1 component beta subunit
LDELDISTEVIDLRTLCPIDEPLILASLEKTGRLVVVQDATGPCSISSEVVRIAATDGFSLLRARPVRVVPPFAPVPFPPDSERAYFPQSEDIVMAVQGLVVEASA